MASQVGFADAAHRLPHLLAEIPPVAAAQTLTDGPDSLLWRAALALPIALLFALITGRFTIPWLAAHCGERVASGSVRLDELHKAKNRTPTMGGLFLVGGILAAALLCGDGSSLALPIVVLIAFTTIGAIDDWTKLTTARRGLSARQKLALQVLAGLAAGFAAVVWDPAIAAGTPWRWLPAPLWIMAVLVTSSNAVNLTDGLDGLASGCVIISATALAALLWLTRSELSDSSLETLILLAAVIGSTLGFLWFNRHPAKVFMGDTGSLSLGAVLADCAIAVRQEWTYAIAGGVFAIEMLSVIAQVLSFKLTGRRVLACSPLHNHFVFRGLSERRIVRRFWMSAAVCACGSVLLKAWGSLP